MTNYKKGTIYKIICYVSDDVYIGSTFSTLRNRWTAHKTAYKNYMNGNNRSKTTIYPYFEKYGIEHFKIIKIKEYECVDKKHLESKEQLWINKSRCVNTNNTFRIKKMCQKVYYENNVNEIKKKVNLYRKEHKRKIEEYNKKYYKNNKEQITKLNKLYRENNKEKIKEDNKEWYEKNKEKILKINKLYREKNKRKIEEYGKTYRKNNKEKIEEYNKKLYTCITCNTTIKIGGKSRHEKTQKHLKNL